MKVTKKEQIALIIHAINSQGLKMAKIAHKIDNPTVAKEYLKQAAKKEAYEAVYEMMVNNCTVLIKMDGHN